METTPMRNAEGEEAGGDALRNVSLRLDAFGSCVSKSACDGGKLLRGSFCVCLEHHVIDPREEKKSHGRTTRLMQRARMEMRRGRALPVTVGMGEQALLLVRAHFGCEGTSVFWQGRC
jgi:hypothetical protein